MHCLKVDYWWATKNPYLHLYFLGDIHAGAKACDIERLDADIAAIKRDSAARVILMGDLGEFIKRSDKRFDPRTVWGWLLERNDMAEAQSQWVVERFTPIKDKVVAVCEGNHEGEIASRYEHDIHQRIRIGLGVPSLGYYGMVRFTCRRKDNPKDGYTFDIAAHHGFGYGTTDGAVLTSLYKLLAVYDVDIAAMGHRHKRLHIEPTIMRFVDARKEPYTEERQRLGLCSGTYLKTFIDDVDTYSGKKNYQPVRTGCVMVKVRIPERDMRIEF